jgi:translation elongation factor EF-4
MVVPAEFYGAMCELIKERRGEDIETYHLDDGQVAI